VRRTSFAGNECPIARAADTVGDLWSLLILRDVLDGCTRFDEFASDLGIAPNMLTRRLTALVEAGLLERRRYQDNPPRDEYLLTGRGRAFQPVVLALFAAGSQGTAAGDRTLALVDRESGTEVDPVLVDRVTGRPLDQIDLAFTAGPAASPRLRDRFRRLATASAART
jgi:DNA-binding HxlR family transcriptional regulator